MKVEQSKVVVGHLQMELFTLWTRIMWMVSLLQTVSWTETEPCLKHLDDYLRSHLTTFKVNNIVKKALAKDQTFKPSQTFPNPLYAL